MQVSANSFAQKISLNQKDITLEQFFRRVRLQTGYNVFYSDQEIDDQQILNASFNNTPLQEAMSRTLEDRHLTFVLIGKDIVIKKKEQTLKERLIKALIAIEARGRVVDDKGLPLPGASVVVKGSSKSVGTNLDGEFVMKNVEEGSVLVISFIGFLPKEVKAARQMGDIALSIDNSELDEVQVVAYGTQKKATVTGAISSIGSKELLRSPNASIGNILAGSMSGISSVQYSGQPGADDPSIFVRGTATLNNDRAAPLILVDGVERSFFRMDPNEIENVTVLKDASATAVFGVRGANGVILVTTKRGKEGKAEISVSSSVGITQPLRLPEMASSYDHAMLYNEMELSDNPNLLPSQLHFSPFVLDMFKTGTDPIMFPNTDWKSMLFKNSSLQRQHNINISGGTSRVRYFVSLGNLYQDGLLKRQYEDYDPNYRYNRYNYRSNLDIDVTKTTLLKLNIGGRFESRFEPNNDTEVNNIWTEILRAQSFSSPGFIDGKLVTNSNIYIPHVMRNGFQGYYGKGYRQIADNTSNLDLSVNQKLDFVTKGLSIEAKGAYNTSYSIAKTRASSVEVFHPVYMSTITNPTLAITDPSFDRTIVYRQEGTNNALSYAESYGKARNWYFDVGTRYDRTFGNHKVGGLFLYNMSRTYYPQAYTDIPRGYLGLVGRATYSFKDKYLVDINAGYNGSENFAKGRRYGFFPAGSVGWIISEENFMKKLSFINLFKVRGSYGIVGNDILDSQSRFLYLSSSYDANRGGYYFGENIPNQFPGVEELKLGNPLVTWETAAKQNYGIDLALLKQRLTLTGDLFFENRDDILIQQNTIPGVVAADLPAVNIGKVDNRGWELSLGWNDKAGSDFRYWTKLNVSFSRNKIVFKDEVPQVEPYLYETGRPTGMNFGYQFNRFFESGDFNEDGSVKDNIPKHPGGGFKPGDLMLRDLNADNLIDGSDMTYFGYSENPEYTIGFNGGFEFKNFDLSMTWTAATNVSRRFEEDYTRPFNTGSAPLMQYMVDERWTPEKGQSATFPRFTSSNRGYNSMISDFWVKDASYIRLKNIELGYNLHPEFLKKMGVQRLRVYMNGYNLLTFDHLEFIDPESKVGSRNKYPNSRIYNFGVNVNF